MSALERWSVQQADGVAVIHDRFKRRMIRRLGAAEDSICVVRNWTHVRATEPFDRTAFRAGWGWGTRTVVLHAGAIGEKQGLSNVIEAARLAEGRSLDLLFVLIGDGGRRAELERQADGLRNVQFIDPLPDEAYGRAMRSADVLLVNERPGVREMAVPSKLTSYFSTGVPVLAASETGSTTAEELAASGAGVRVDPGSPLQLVEAALALGSDLARASTMGSMGLDYCSSVLSENVAIDAYESWMYELVDRAERRRGER